MPFVAVNGRRLYVESRGAGTALVLVHHATGSSRSWRRQVPMLSSRFRVVAYDRPGFGRSDWLTAWPKDYLQADVDDLVGLLDSLGVGVAALMGHSDGATIALMAAAQHAERVACVVAESPHVSVELPGCPVGVSNYAEKVRRSPGLQAALQREHSGRGLQVIERWANRWLDPEFWDWDVSDQLAMVRCPVLVVHGSQDLYFSVEHARLIAGQVADGQLWIVPEAGHTPHAEAAEPFNREVLAFLRAASA